MKIGVIGAGTMGSGIAQCFAIKDGYEVVLCDINQSAADEGRGRIKSSLEKQLEKGKLDDICFNNALSSITTGTIESLFDCNLIIEAAVENLSIKKEVFSKLIKICPSDTIFASNTSSLSPTEMSQGLDRPVIGIHFFNPAPVMKLVEVIAGIHVEDMLIEKIISILEDIGKTPIRVKEGAGFVVNRILVPMINEAIGVYADGLASVEDIDTAMKLGANHPIGPLALGDLIGLDVCLAIMEILHYEFGDPKYRPHPLLRKMVRGGIVGRKSKQGFYTY